MKISAFALASALALGPSYAFTGITFDTRFKGITVLNALANPASHGRSTGGRSEDEIRAELNSGKVLEGGKIIDFASVKGPSRAESALASAKNDIMERTEKYVPSTSVGILGINEEVIAEVGHTLGAFASPSDIQACAVYIRSMAPSGLFQKRPNDISSDVQARSPEDIERFESILRQAFYESGEVTSAFAKTFYMGTQLLPQARREAIWAVYVWCRRTDEIVDAPRDNDDDMLLDLASWEIRLENLWKYGDVEDVFDLCLLDVLVKYPTLPITPFMDMIRGMLMDVPILGQDRYETFDELHLYCYRVAGTVGLMSLPIFGCGAGFDEEISR